MGYAVWWERGPWSGNHEGNERGGEGAVRMYYTRTSSASLVAQMVERLPAMQETQVRSLGREEPLEKEMTSQSSTLAWKIPWTEEPGGLQFMGLQRVGHDWVTLLLSTFPCLGISYPQESKSWGVRNVPGLADAYMEDQSQDSGSSKDRRREVVGGMSIACWKPGRGQTGLGYHLGLLRVMGNYWKM